MRVAREDRHALWRRFSGLLMLCIAGVAGITAVVHYATAGHRFEMTRDAEAAAVEMGRSELVRAFRSTVADLYFLAELTALEGFLATEGEGEADALARELIAFSRQRGIYERIQVVDAAGTVLMRIEENAGTPVAVARTAAADGPLREDFRRTLACPEAIVYMSTLDPSAAPPGGASVRFGVGVGKDGGERAVLLATLRGGELLAGFERHRAGGSADVMLLDGEGRRVGEGAGDRPLGLAGVRFQEAFPEEWDRISSDESGQFQTEKGLFSYATVRPLGEVWDAACALAERPMETPRPASEEDLPVWKVVSRIPAESLHAVASADLGLLTATGAAGVFVLGIGSWALARRGERRRAQESRIAESHRLLSSTFSRYMSDELRERLLGEPDRYERLGGEARPASVLFADLRGFTAFAESRDPQIVVETLNRILSRLVGAVQRHGGILDKFVGDGLMAFFEAAPDGAEAARRAVAAAVDLHREFETVRPTLDSSARELGLGIGVGSGTVVVGNVGSEKAMDFTVIGDPVNVAARLESAAGRGEILLDEATAGFVGGAVSAERLPDLSLKGKRRPVAAYSVRIEPAGNEEG